MKRLLLILIVLAWTATSQAATTRYADGTLATGANNGTSWADAYRGATGLQSALTASNSGDTLYCRNTFTLTVAGTQTNSGVTAAPIRVIGCNASGVEDGTQCIWTQTGSGLYALVEGQSYWRFDNITFTGTGSAGGINGNAVNGFNVFVNCKFTRPGGAGMLNENFCKCYGCEFTGCSVGCQITSKSHIVNCSFNNNTSGLTPTPQDTVVGCYFYNNSGANINANGGLSIIGCTFNGGTSVFNGSSFPNLIADCRFTNMSSGTAIQGTSNHVINTFAAGVTNTGSANMIADFKGSSGLTVGTTGSIGYSSTATGSALQMASTASGYWTSMTTTDGAIYTRSQGVNASQNPATYSTSASKILSGSFSATGGTLGTAGTTWNVSSGTQVLSGFVVGGSDGSTYTGSASQGTTVKIGATTVNSGTLTLTGGTAQLTGSIGTSCSGTLFSGMSLAGTNLYTAGGTVNIGGTTTGGSLTGSYSGGTALTISPSSVRYGTVLPSGAGGTVTGSAPIPGPVHNCIEPERPWLTQPQADRTRRSIITANGVEEMP